MNQVPETGKPNQAGDSSSSPYGSAFAGSSPTTQVIAALASGGQQAAIAVIRITGPGCFDLLQPVLPKLKTDDSELRKLQWLRFYDAAQKVVIDEPLVALFKAPASFTGEDSAEIYCHGGPYIIRQLLTTLYQLGIRPAEPGEFTKRAFLNGKMDLTAAEGIRELIEAHSQHQWQAARYMSEGRFATYVQQLRQSLIRAMAFLEARIDFPDEGDTQSVELTGVAARVREVDQQLARLEATYDNGRIARQGLKVAILGAPNMGKSTLMNELLGRERAIVTDIAGTTRDYLEETCLVEGRAICLIDTAGVRQTEDQVERLGVEKAMALGAEADLVLLLIAADASPEVQAESAGWRKSLGDAKCLMVVTKCDLKPITERSLAESLAISCRTQVGLDELRRELASRVDQSVGTLGDEPFLTSARHLAAVSRAREALAAFFAGLEEQIYEEMLAFELQNAAKALADIIGQVDHEDILDQVFGEFCVGK
jgi:tRNA modification GTPase